MKAAQEYPTETELEMFKREGESDVQAIHRWRMNRQTIRELKIEEAQEKAREAAIEAELDERYGKVRLPEKFPCTGLELMRTRFPAKNISVAKRERRYLGYFQKTAAAREQFTGSTKAKAAEALERFKTHSFSTWDEARDFAWEFEDYWKAVLNKVRTDAGWKGGKALRESVKAK